MMEIIRPQRLLFESLTMAAGIAPDKTAIIAEGKAYSYKEFYESAVKLANSLISHGFKRGDRCVIFMDNTWECAVSIYATSIAGGVFVVVNPQTKTEKLEYIINDCGATILISDAHLFNVYSINFL